MSINDTLTVLANQFRNHINSTEKLGLYDMAYLLTTHDFSLKKQVNLLCNTDPLPSDVSLNYTTNKKYWCLGSSGQGVGSVFELNDNNLRATHGFRITDNNGGNRDFVQGPIFYEGGKYTFSILARLPKDAKVSSVTSLIRVFDKTGTKSFFNFTKLITSHDWQELTGIIDASQVAGNLGGDFQFGISGEGSIEYAQPMLNFGTEKAEWNSNYLDDVMGVAPLDLFNPDLTTWDHSNIKIFSENGYQVATLPPDGSQLQTRISWEQGKAYRWTFEAKADYPRDTIHTEMWGGIGYNDYTLTTDWKEYSSSGTPNLAHNNFYFWNSSNHGNVYLRNIRIYEA